MLVVILVFSFLAVALFFYAYFYEPNRVIVEREECFSQKITETIRILQISDLHLYEGMSKARIASFKSTLSEVYREGVPDLILITGDTLDKESGLSLLDDILESFQTKAGVYAVLGNHDYFQYNIVHLFFPKAKNFGERMNTAALIQKYKENGIRVLNDEVEDLKIGTNQLRIIGLAMRSGKKAEIPQNLISDDASSKLLTVVLSHYPDAVRALRGKVDLIFSGHTHGGQLTFFGHPLTARTKLSKKYAKGLSFHGTTNLWVSKGVGVSHYLPFRFFARPDVTLMTLRGRNDE